MNFLISVLLFAIVILILFNFTSISISNTPNAGTCSNQNYLISSLQKSIMQPTQIPQPIPAKSSNHKDALSIKQPVYDYNKYFFVKSSHI
jgi:hypothetical protein